MPLSSAPSRPAAPEEAPLSRKNSVSRPASLCSAGPVIPAQARAGDSRPPTPAPPAPATALAHRDRALTAFNGAEPAAAEASLLACCGSRRWAKRLADHRPYPDVPSLLAAADEALYDLSPADVTEALTRETFSPDLLVPVGSPSARAAHTALRAAHDAYEIRFEHAFVLCLDDFHADEVLDQTLAAIRRRLGHERDEERAVSADELRRLARGRLRRLVTTPPAAR
ncbi:2-oxo-4-hydroxy-4-carboxy-5-ureidoimidazoline decarboxylase [Streptomyces sp. NPDC059740]|uniref:2-oxo-4-hydroxy-4-carboxy-5-ureidoimidazoline decarboxylase n=1 Tax=Streptomyces sp. NPDC059740 TaxID=3346926 RepID=UPI003648E70F